jgi:UDP-N-acetylglucosamine acyltransferase
MIHHTAIVSAGAQLHATVEVGPYSIIEDNVVIGAGTKIASSVLIASGARIGANVRISHGAVIATIPQDLKFGGEETTATIGDNTIIREYVTVNRGTRESGSTDVGRDCLLMAYAHVAHDGKIGDHVIMANAVNLGGHVHIDDWAIIGGVVPVHQFTHVGAHAMIGGGFRITQDVCPYGLLGGYPLRVLGTNHVGLRRRNFPAETIATLQSAYRLLFFSHLNTRQALERIREEVPQNAEVRTLVEFIGRSTRGIIK